MLSENFSLKINAAFIITKYLVLKKIIFDLKNKNENCSTNMYCANKWILRIRVNGEVMYDNEVLVYKFVFY